MPDLSTLLLFSAASLALTATPGPDMLLIASRSVSQGKLAGLLTYAGIAAGCYCHALMVAFGLAQLFLLVPAAFDIVRFAGAAYLLYLAWQTLRSKPDNSAAVAAPRKRKRRIFSEGLITNLLNPKMALFMLALFPQFLKPEAGSVVMQTMVLVTILNVIGLLVNGVVIIASGTLRQRLSKGGSFGRWPQYLLAGVFTGLAVRLAFSGRN
ncbi:LysE family translocator [Kordiimonas lacus]|uniref:Threonine/homoserine/homoserine lactone efflux protein n=1 Tax=Kordiimonas lacus TaxID=637679 RepID=A0A1G6W3F3_9PROT|nr:LysE family translocator [Kordiimonas lacus]SDD60349.1 Threonine/homoserine/homoserine lactone efflux protein [Kordiimonas lacus]